jgi:putative nucleotidyltransferase with HDIG domain
MPRGLGPWYVGAVGLVGVLVFGDAIHTLSTSPIGYQWVVLAVLTWIAGSFAIKVPGVQATVYVSETFVFTMVLLYGGAPAIVTIAIDGLLISIRRRNREVQRIVFNAAEPAISVWLAATLFFRTARVPPLSIAPTALPALLLPVLLMSLAFFASNSWLNALAVTTETGESPYRVWRQHFLWLSLNYVGGASLALILAVNAPHVGLSGLGVIVPLLVISYLTFKSSMARMEESNRHLTELVETLAMAIDAKDQVTHGHIRRVQSYALALARALGISDEKQLKAIEAAALLHDVGKLAVPEYILNKPGKLTSAEYERMKLHAPVGASILSAINFPYPVVPIVRHHHENWDGTGYPDGLMGTDIPLGARIMSVVDCFDAVTSDRPYRPALSAEEALSITAKRKGTMYDPHVVDGFVKVHAEIGPHEGDVPCHPATLSHLARLPVTASADEPPVPSGPHTVTAADEMLQLCDLSGELIGHATLGDAAEIMSRHLRRLVPASLIVFFVRDQGSDVLVPAHISGVEADFLKGIRIPLGHGLSGWVAANRTIMVNANPALDLGDHLHRLPTRLESALSIPLIMDDELICVLTMYTAVPGAFTDDHRRAVQTVASQIAACVRQATSFEQDRASRLRDHLTGLPNALYLSHLSALRGVSDSQPGLAFGVLCLAVGGDNGDGQPPADLLKAVAAATRSALRSTDLVFQCSRGELVILMADSTPAVTHKIADRILEAVLSDCSLVRSQIRAGLACAPADGRSVGELLNSARTRTREQGPGWPAHTDSAIRLSR